MPHYCFMFSAFFQSIQYTGLYLPVAILRIFIGYHFFQEGLKKAQGDFLVQPRLAAEISEWLPQSQAPLWYKSMMGEHVIEYWRVFAYSITYFELMIGVSFILGFFVRPAALLGVILCANYYFNTNPLVGGLHQIYMILFFIMGMLGAGRSLGFDYFFFKRHRGIWW